MRLRLIATLVSIAVLLTGCAQYSEQAVAARMEISTMNAYGIEQATATLAAKVEELHAKELLKTDTATIQSVLVAVNEGMPFQTIEEKYIEDAAKSRASLAAFRADWDILVGEFAEAAKNQRLQGRLTQRELEAARRINLFKEDALK